VTEEVPYTDNLLRGYWIRNNKILKHENYIKSDRFKYTGNAFITERMYFYQGYALHGTYWHNNFGTPMSHGCVNMPTPEAEWAFNWASIGTPVIVQP
jgi:lipoprotein-anchoring transpeptidase ErfK/SrfK